MRHLGLPMGKTAVGRVSSGKMMVELMEHMRGKDVFMLQSTCSHINNKLMW